MPVSVRGITRPRISGKVFDDPGSKRVRLNVSQHRDHVRSVLNHGALEPALPDVARRTMPLVVPPGVCNGNGLKNSADRLPFTRLQQQVEVVVHEAITEQTKRVTLTRPVESLQEALVIVRIVEDGATVVAPVEGVIDESVRDWPG